VQRSRRLVEVAAVLALLGPVGLVACGGDEEPGAVESTTTTTTTTTTSTTTTSEPTTPEPQGPTVVRVTVVDGAPRGGIVRASVDEGERVVLAVTSDVADEVHLHGYDLSRALPAGGSVRITFTATLPGRFEVELEERGAPIAELTVEP
jgi:hypothetical protein